MGAPSCGAQIRLGLLRGLCGLQPVLVYDGNRDFGFAHTVTKREQLPGIAGAKSH